MSQYLITHSLLNSWQYLYNAYDEEKAEQDFLSTLNRMPIPPNEAMQNGLDFEELVQRICEGKPIGRHISVDVPKAADELQWEYDRPDWGKWIGAANKVAEIVKGGRWQLKANKAVTINGINFLLYGRIDVLKAGTIYDLKFSKSYEVGKYLDYPQHPMYTSIVDGVIDFKYIISDGNDVFEERYKLEDCPPIEDKIIGFMEYLELAGLTQIYFEKWVSYGDRTGKNN